MGGQRRRRIRKATRRITLHPRACTHTPVPPRPFIGRLVWPAGVPRGGAAVPHARPLQPLQRVATAARRPAGAGPPRPGRCWSGRPPAARGAQLRPVPALMEGMGGGLRGHTYVRPRSPTCPAVGNASCVAPGVARRSSFATAHCKLQAAPTSELRLSPGIKRLLAFIAPLPYGCKLGPAAAAARRAGGARRDRGLHARREAPRRR